MTITDASGYGNNVITSYASAGINACDDEAKFAFETGLSLLSNNSGKPSIVYGNTLLAIIGEQSTFLGFPGAIGSWVRNGQQLQYLYPALNEEQIKQLTSAINRLPSDGQQRMQIVISSGHSDAEIANELRGALGSLITDEDIAAFIASLASRKNGSLLVDIYDLYQEILARYQTHLHADEDVWQAEIEVKQAEATLEAQIELYGTGVCNSRVKAKSQACNNRKAILAKIEQNTEQYLATLSRVNNDMVSSGLMPLMELRNSLQTQAREQFASVTVAVAGVFVPLTLQDAAIDITTYGFGRFARVGEAIAGIVRTAKGASKAALNRAKQISDKAVERVQELRSKLIKNKIPGSTRINIKQDSGDSFFDMTDQWKRGKDIENAAATKPPYNKLTQTEDFYPGVDFIDEPNKVAISMFSTNAKDMYKSITGKTRDFNEKFSGEVRGFAADGVTRLVLDSNQYRKILDVVVQKGKVSDVQYTQIQKAIAHGKTYGIEIRIVEAP